MRDKVLNLVCRETLSVPEDYKVRRYYEAKHPDLANT
jgi:hypothetical protein